MKIYIAGPYSASTEEGRLKNTYAAIDAAIELRHRGHFPFTPHLCHWVDKRAEEIGRPLGYQDYIDWDDAFLEDCDALLYLQSSPGADKELALAKKLNKKIYTAIDDIE